MNTSDTRRPGVVTFDGKTGFDMGGIDLGDTSQGLFARPYKVYAEGTGVYIQKGLENTWSLPELLFEHEGNIEQLNLTFDQNARPFVVWEDNGNIWIYWYNPVNAQNEKALICAGRCPVSTLDYRYTIYMGESDIMLFYIDGTNVKYRQQRDRFTIEYSTDIVLQEEEYLEALWPAPNFRLYLYYTSRLSGKYEIHYWHSSLYPVPVTDNINTGVELVDVRVKRLCWIKQIDELVNFQGFNFGSITIEQTFWDPIEMYPDELVNFQGFNFGSITIEQTFWDPIEMYPDELVNFQGFNFGSITMEQTFWDPIEMYPDELVNFQGFNFEDITMEQTCWN